MIDYVCKTETTANQHTTSDHIDKDSTGRGMTPVHYSPRGSSNEDPAEVRHPGYEPFGSPFSMGEQEKKNIRFLTFEGMYNISDRLEDGDKTIN